MMCASATQVGPHAAALSAILQLGPISAATLRVSKHLPTTPSAYEPDQAARHLSKVMGTMSDWEASSGRPCIMSRWKVAMSRDCLSNELLIRLSAPGGQPES